MKVTLVNALRQVEYFSDLPEHILIHLAFLMNKESVEPGGLLYSRSVDPDNADKEEDPSAF